MPGPTEKYRVELLGAPRITTGVGSIPTSEPLLFVSALYLCLNMGRAISRSHLASLLWPDLDEHPRSIRFRQLVMRLRRYEISFEPRAPEVRLETDDVLVDVDALGRATSVAEAMAMVRGDVLQGFEPRLSDTMSRWLEDTRDSARAHVIRELDGWLSAAVRAGHWSDAERLAQLMLNIRANHAGARRALGEARRMQSRVASVLSESDTRGLAGPDSRARLDDAVRVRSNPMVGRADLLARLLEAVEAPDTVPRRVGIAGPPGIGKTRLLHELGGVARARGAQVARLRCGHGDRLRPLSLVIDLARELLRLRGALGASPESAEVLRRLTGEIAPEDSAQTPEVRRTAVYAALRDLVGALTEEARLVVVIDDAQWAELGSWSILAPIFAQELACWIVALRVETQEESRERFAAVFPADGAAWEQGRELHWLAPLTDEAIGALCVSRAAHRSIPSDALTALVHKAAGIPFIAETVVDHWLATGDVACLPATVSRLVQARLDRLSPEAAQVLVTVAVLGLDAVFPAIEAVTRLDRNALLRATRELEAAGITRPDDAMLFAHALWIEAALRRTPSSTKQLLHRYAAEWLELSATALEGVEPRRHWAIVTHWVDAGEPAKARLGLDRAATLLAGSGFPAEGAQMLERAAELTGASDATLQFLHRAAELWLLDETQATIDGVLRIRARYDEVARARDPEGFVMHHEVELLAHLALNRKDPSNVEDGLRMRDCVTAPNASRMHRLNAAYHLLARYSFFNWEHATLDVIWRTVEGITAKDEDEWLLFHLCASQYYSRYMERPALAISHAKQAHALIITSRSRIDKYYVGCMSIVAESYEHLGDVDLSLTTMKDMLARGQECKNAVIIGNALNGLIGTCLELGRVEAARALLPLFGRARSIDGVIVDFARSVYWAVCALEEGNAAEARNEFRIPLEEGYLTQNVTKRARIFAIYAHIAFLDRDDVMAQLLLPRLIECFSGRTTFMEHPAHVTAMLLARYESRQAAEVFVRRFMELRVERWTPRRELLQFLDVQSDPEDTIAASASPHIADAAAPKNESGFRDRANAIAVSPAERH